MGLMRKDFAREGIPFSFFLCKNSKNILVSPGETDSVRISTY